MKASIEVGSRQEADQIRKGLADPVARAYVRIVGALSELPTDRARRRVFEFVRDSIAEASERQDES